MLFANVFSDTNVCIENRSLKPVSEWCLCEKCISLNTDRECVVVSNLKIYKNFVQIKNASH